MFYLKDHEQIRKLNWQTVAGWLFASMGKEFINPFHHCHKHSYSKLPGKALFTHSGNLIFFSLSEKFNLFA